jgi:hypothetical protein
MPSSRSVSLSGPLHLVGVGSLQMSSLSIMSCSTRTKRFISRDPKLPSVPNLVASLFIPLALEIGRSGLDGNWFYCKVRTEQMADVWGKENYPLSYKMTQLNYLANPPFDYDPKDRNVAAFAEAASIIGGCDAVEEFLACTMWPLSEKLASRNPLLKVVVPMSKVYAHYQCARVRGSLREVDRECHQFAGWQL